MCTLLAPTKSGVLQYMGHTSFVRRVCFETDGEPIISIISAEMQIAGTGLVMLKLVRCELQLRHVLVPLQSETVKLLAWLQVMADILCSCGKAPSCMTQSMP